MENNSTIQFKVLATIIILFILRFLNHLFTQKQTKEDLAKQYNITKPTLGKWARFFQKEISEEEWKAKRKLNLFEIGQLKMQWGSDVQYVLNKNEIAAKAESDYKTVSQNVKMNLEKIGITLEAWESTSIFPPAVSKRILEILG